MFNISSTTSIGRVELFTKCYASLTFFLSSCFKNINHKPSNKTSLHLLVAQANQTTKRA